MTDLYGLDYTMTPSFLGSFEEKDILNVMDVPEVPESEIIGFGGEPCQCGCPVSTVVEYINALIANFSPAEQKKIMNQLKLSEGISGRAEPTGDVPDVEFFIPDPAQTEAPSDSNLFEFSFDLEPGEAHIQGSREKVFNNSDRVLFEQVHDPQDVEEHDQTLADDDEAIEDIAIQPDTLKKFKKKEKKVEVAPEPDEEAIEVDFEIENTDDVAPASRLAENVAAAMAVGDIF